MSQRKLHSLLEAFVNVVVGYLVNIGAQIVVFPLFGLYVDLSTNLMIGVIYTFISIARSYLLRRAFNAWF